VPYTELLLSYLEIQIVIILAGKINLTDKIKLLDSWKNNKKYILNSIALLMELAHL
jgi:hypothetical protein